MKETFGFDFLSCPIRREVCWSALTAVSFLISFLFEPQGNRFPIYDSNAWTSHSTYSRALDIAYSLQLTAGRRAIAVDPPRPCMDKESTAFIAFGHHLRAGKLSRQPQYTNLPKFVYEHGILFSCSNSRSARFHVAINFLNAALRFSFQRHPLPATAAGEVPQGEENRPIPSRDVMPGEKNTIYQVTSTFQALDDSTVTKHDFLHQTSFFLHFAYLPLLLLFRPDREPQQRQL